MTSYVTPKKNSAYVFGVSLWSQATAGSFQANPTLAAGDVKISKDGGAFANLTNLPTVNPASGKRVEVSLTSTEMNADNITVVFSDAAGSEWYDLAAHIQTSARQIDDLAYPATSGRSMVVDAAGLVDANMVKAGPTGSGTAITARDIGASVLLSAGTGTGQLDFTSGVVKANLAQILGTALTETAGQIAAGFKKLFDVASPVFTLLSVVQTGDSYPRIGAPAGASVSADIAAAKVDTAAIKVQTDKLTFTVANQVDSNVKSNAGTAITAAAGIQEVKVASLAANAITATSIAADAITDAKVAADVTIASVTGAVGSVTGNVGGSVASVTAGVTLAASAVQAIWDALTSALTTVGSIGKLLVTNIDAAISSRLASGSYTAPDNSSITAIKAKTDSLTFTKAGEVDSNIQSVNDTTVNGIGTAGSPWGP